MKLMNEINMPEDGEIAWVAATAGDTVEYGQLLFRYV
jgi:biotin carboxyl carrier protein